MVVLDRHPSKLRLLERGYRISAETDLQRALAQAGLLILAVRPESVADLVSEIANVERKFLAVSLAA
ncbi:MAG: pyrroline-5-carboxylate reductase, partial [Acidobacteria bacterium]